jgi:DNA-binding PadR family transcriptional regulator
MEDLSSVVTNMEQELRRGTVTLCVLSRLDRPKYGYALVEELAGAGVSIEPGTLYPLLRRLESQGLLISEWETSGPKPRKYYVRGEAGERIYKLLCGEWSELARSIDRLITGSPMNENSKEGEQ